MVDLKNCNFNAINCHAWETKEKKFIGLRHILEADLNKLDFV
jgi:pyruvate-formate lyase-activating enzyme